MTHVTQSCSTIVHYFFDALHMMEAFASPFNSSERLPTQQCAIILHGGSFRRAKSSWESLRKCGTSTSTESSSAAEHTTKMAADFQLHQLRERTLERQKTFASTLISNMELQTSLTCFGAREVTGTYIYRLWTFVHLISLASTSFFLDDANILNIMLLSSGLRV